MGFFRANGGQAVPAAEPQAAPAGAGPAPVPPVENNNITPNTDSPSESASPAQPQADRPSLLSLTWSIFSSFFLSLIPEQPNVI